MSTLAASEDHLTASVRLHITPLTPELLNAYLSPALRAIATNVEFHSIQTFPEKTYGYLELPLMEAGKLKKKLNGSIFKGAKVRIEEARPEKKRKVSAEGDAEEGKSAERKSKRSKKDKKKDDVMEGHELPEDRKVKRGWTEPASEAKKHRKSKDKKDKKAKREPSKYTKEPEMLFKTKLPPNVAAEAKDAKAERKPKKSKKPNREVVVHEFEKTKKHASFLKGSQTSGDAKPSTEFIKGKGWVDEDGNVIEAIKAKRRKHAETLDVPDIIVTPDTPSVDKKHAAAVASKSPSEADKKKPEKPVVHNPEDSTTSSSESDSDSESDGPISSVENATASEASAVEEESVDAAAIESTQPTITVDPPQPTNNDAQTGTEYSEAKTEKEVHPFEALFKRPAAPASTEIKSLAPIQTSFSFFSADDAANGEDATPDAAANNPPQTPFTRQDLRVRGIRSAAPTPDTAAIGGRRYDVPWDGDDDEDEDEDANGDGGDTATAGSVNDVMSTANGAEGEEKEESEFAKLFWEKRGDTNRAWKQRRREALKQKRQRENRRLNRRVI